MLSLDEAAHNLRVQPVIVKDGHRHSAVRKDSIPLLRSGPASGESTVRYLDISCPQTQSSPSPSGCDAILDDEATSLLALQPLEATRLDEEPSSVDKRGAFAELQRTCKAHADAGLGEDAACAVTTLQGSSCLEV